MRARNLKPSFFENEELGSSDPLHSLLFAGLWCAADREGRLEDRPLRLCGQIFRYRREVTLERMEELMAWLDAHGFIKRYERDGGRYVQVVQFLKHQRPHSKEKNSEIPPFSNARKTRPRRGQAPTQVGASTDLGHAQHALTPDSGLLTPDSGSLTPESPIPRSAKEGQALPVVRQLPRSRRSAPVGHSRNGSHKAREPEPETAKAERALQLLQADPTLGEGDAARMCHTTVDAIRALKA